MNKLSIYLKNHGISQKEFADAVGLSQSAVSRLCSGNLGVSIHKAFEIERTTGGEVPALEWARTVDQKAAS